MQNTQHVRVEKSQDLGFAERTPTPTLGVEATDRPAFPTGFKPCCPLPGGPSRKPAAPLDSVLRILLAAPHRVPWERLASFLKPTPFSPAPRFVLSVRSLRWVEECAPKLLPFLDLRM